VNVIDDKGAIVATSRGDSVEVREVLDGWQVVLVRLRPGRGDDLEDREVRQVIRTYDDETKARSIHRKIGIRLR
jgi:hypothetical protein